MIINTVKLDVDPNMKLEMPTRVIPTTASIQPA